MAKDKNRCRVCGYKFKRGDPDICPECFTSREETMDCDDLSQELHSHEKGFGNSEDAAKSDAQLELEKERRQASDLLKKYEARKQESAIPKQISSGGESYGPSVGGNPDPAGGQSGSSSASGNSGSIPSSISSMPMYSRLTDAQRKKLEAFYNSRNNSSASGNTFSTYSSTTSGRSFGTNTYSPPSSNKSEKPKALKIFLTVFILIIVFNVLISIIGGFIAAGNVRTNTNNNNKNDSIDYSEAAKSPYYESTVAFGSQFDVCGTEFVIDMPQLSGADIKNSFPNFMNTIDMNGDHYNDNWYIMSIPITMSDWDGETSFNDINFKLISYSSEEEYGYDSIISNSLLNGISEPGTIGGTSSGAYFYAVPKADRYEYIVTFYNDEGMLEKYTYSFHCDDYSFYDVQQEPKDLSDSDT